MDSAVGALGEGFANGLRHARGTGADHDHFAAVLLAQLQGFFESVGVGLVDLEAQVVFVDPGSGGVHAQRRIAEGNLLDRYGDLHVNVFADAHPSFLKIRQPLVPPKPNEFESA